MPRAADPVALLEHDEVAEPGLVELDRGADPGEAGADHGDLVIDRDIRSIHVVRILMTPSERGAVGSALLLARATGAALQRTMDYPRRAWVLHGRARAIGLRCLQRARKRPDRRGSKRFPSLNVSDQSAGLLLDAPQ